MNQIKFERNKKLLFYCIVFSYLYFLIISLRKASKALIILEDEKKSYVSVWNWIQRFGYCHIYIRKKSNCFY